MADRNEATGNNIFERIRASSVRDAARSNRQALQVQQPSPSQPAPLGAETQETQENDSRSGIRQTLDRWERDTQGIISVGATTSATTSAMNVETAHQEQCNFCREDFPLSSLGNIRCTHYICDSCLIGFFELSLEDESLFPPRCCGHRIRLRTQDAEMLSADLIERFSRRKEDVDAERVARSRTFCHVPRCSARIWPRFISENMAICPECKALTCTACKEKYHDNGVCTKEGELEVPGVEDLGAINGWQRCPSCRQVIERNEGCTAISQLTIFFIKRCDRMC